MKNQIWVISHVYVFFSKFGSIKKLKRNNSGMAQVGVVRKAQYTWRAFDVLKMFWFCPKNSDGTKCLTLPKKMDFMLF